MENNQTQAPQPKPVVQQSQSVTPKKSNVLVMGLGAIVLLGAGLLGGYFLFGNKTQVADTQSNQITSTSPTTSQQISPTSAIAALTTLSPNSQRFISQKLTISFDYAKKDPLSGGPSYEVKTLEEGDKVYVYMDNGSNPHEGQSVEVFKKDPNLTLAEAIKKQFLTNYSEKDCFVNKQSTYPDSMHFPINYEVAEISFPKTSNATDPWWKNADKCPKNYTTTNGISYFVMDKNHPSIFVYLSIGQYGISSGSGNPQELWQDTLRLTP